MASPAQIAANQINSRKSTGPTTPEGRARSAMNALKHGNRSRKLAMLREESCAFEERLRKWMAIGDAQNDVEEYLVYRNVCLSFELDRTERARLERCASLIEKSDEEELTAAQAAGRQLFFDPAGPTPLYGNRPPFAPKKGTSWNGGAVDPNDPAALVKILESNAAGCRWLRNEWQALRAQLESTGFWQSHDRLKAIRLLGRQPVEANDDRRVATIFVASHALRPGGKTAFDDLLGDLQDTQQERYEKAVRERWPDLFGTREKAEWRQILLALADQNIERLNAKLEVHEQNAEAQAERTFARLSFDPSPEGEALRNYLIKCTNALFRGMATYRKYHARTSGRWDGSSGAGLDATQQDRSEDRGRQAHVSDGTELGADVSFESGGVQDDRLERADEIDPGGVGTHEDRISGMREIGEDAPNEPNFDQSMSIAEAQEPNEVTAISGALSALDNALAQRGEGATPEGGEALVSGSERAGAVLGAGLPTPEGSPPSGRPKISTSPTRQSNIARSLGSGSESGDSKPPTPDAIDRARGGNSSVTVSQREQTRLRLEKEKRAVERMVEDKLKAGRFSLREILTSVMALPP